MVDPRSVLRFSWLEGNTGNELAARSFNRRDSDDAGSFRRVKSLPAFVAFSPINRKSMGATSSMSEPVQFRAHLWKKAPGMHLFRYQWRYVVLKDARMYWWATMEASEQEEPKGLIDFTDNMCEVFPDECDHWKFVLMPRMGRWKRGSFTGVNEGRVFRFDCRDSEFNRISWLEAIHAHLRYGEAKRRRGDVKAVLTKMLHPGADAGQLESAIRDGIAANVDKATLEFAAQQLRAKTGIEIDTGTSSFSSRSSLNPPQSGYPQLRIQRAATVREGFNIDMRESPKCSEQFQHRLSDSGEVCPEAKVEADTVAPTTKPFASIETGSNQLAQGEEMSSHSDTSPRSDIAAPDGTGNSSQSATTATTRKASVVSQDVPMERSRSFAAGDEPSGEVPLNIRRLTIHKDMSDGPVWSELRAKLESRRSRLLELDQHCKLQAGNDD